MSRTAAKPPARRRLGLSERLLVSTIAFVMLAEVLIFVPSIANYRTRWLMDKLAAAHAATLVLEAVPEGAVPDVAIVDLLASLDAQAIAVRREGRTQLLTAAEASPPMVDRSYDLRVSAPLRAILDSFDTLLFGGDRIVNVVGAAPDGARMVSLVIPDAPLRRAMWGFAGNILLLSLIISGVTATLVYLTLYRLIVRPMQRLTGSITAFAAEPADRARIIEPSGRADEIGEAEAALRDMQGALARQLKQNERLAQLGLAVSKINHDLRNMLASAQLFSDRLVASRDPMVERFAPKLIAALDRAISFCQATLAYGRASERPPQIRSVDLAELVADTADLLSGGGEGRVRWQVDAPPGFTFAADPEHAQRVLLNLARNAEEALVRAGVAAPLIRVAAHQAPGESVIIVEDNGPGIPEAARPRLFQAFQGSARPGSTGLGLAIAADLVRAHGGTIRLDDRAGPGARFVITLPAVEAREGASPAAASG
jgi:signal transduction histidine kinase